MVNRAGRYYSTLFKGQLEVAQEDPLSPTIFFMVVDAVIRHWVTLVEGEEAVPDVFEQVVQCLEALFYTKNVLLALSRPARIQTALGVLTGFFEKVVLHTNVNKTVGLLFQPCHIVGVHSEVAYTRRMTGVVPSFQERQQEIVWCPYCKM